MTRTHAGRRVLRVTVGLVVLAATALVGARLLPDGEAARTAAPASSAPTTVLAPPAPPSPVLAATDDPRLRDSRIDPLDDAHPAVAGLRAALRSAVQQAARDARDAGVELWLTSGRRSPAYQQELLDEAVARYGSLAEALRFVATPDTSAHVTGDAVDVGPAAADDWLAAHGAAYGLCRTYANEAWHFELATRPGGTCPAPRPDAAG